MNQEELKNLSFVARKIVDLVDREAELIGLDGSGYVAFMNTAINFAFFQTLATSCIAGVKQQKTKKETSAYLDKVMADTKSMILAAVEQWEQENGS